MFTTWWLKYDRLRNFCSWFAHQIKGLNGLITTTILLKRNKFVLKNPNLLLLIMDVNCLICHIIKSNYFLICLSILAIWATELNYLKYWFISKWKASMDKTHSEPIATNGVKEVDFKRSECLDFCKLKW